MAALTNNLHADWTPAMIRSALMTLENTEDNTGKAIVDSGVENAVNATPLVAGAAAELVLPPLAMQPGLMYNADR